MTLAASHNAYQLPTSPHDHVGLAGRCDRIYSLASLPPDPMNSLAETESGLAHDGQASKAFISRDGEVGPKDIT